MVIPNKGMTFKPYIGNDQLENIIQEFLTEN